MIYGMKNKILATIIAFSALTGVEARAPLEAVMERLDAIEERKPKAQDHYNVAMQAMEEKDYGVVAKESESLLKEYPSSVLCSEMKYMQGVAYFELGEYALSNRSFTEYLSDHTQVKHFEDAIRHKFEIASAYANGAKKRLFGGRNSPKLLSGVEDAIEIFDEVITTLPRNELAAQSLYQKGNLLVEVRDYKEAIETYQKLIRRFPKHPLAPESYISIGKTYLDQCKNEFPDPNFVELAQININRFRADFPGETRVAELDEMLQGIQIQFAEELYEHGRYFERRKKPKAAFLYYTNILQRYPSTPVATRADERIDYLKSHVKDPSELVL